jgi:hypothetical protein
MTKYVLNSGGLKNHPDLTKKFFAEVFKGLGDAPRLLICCFAQPRENWEAKFSEDRNSPLFPVGTNPVLELAFPDTFEDQIKKSQAIYIHGGDDHLIQYWLKKFDLPKIWEDKVVATNSGSSHALSSSFWTCDWRQSMNGMGILPIRFLAHFQSSYGNGDPRGPIDWGNALKELSAYGDTSLPIHALKEGDYVVIEK